MFGNYKTLHVVFGVYLCGASVLFFPGKADGLICYECYTTWEFDDCVINPNISAIQNCSESEPFCMVNRNETMGIFTLLKRGCSSTCQTGCGIWGKKKIDIESCLSCCSADLCNTDNSANVINSLSLSLVLTFINIFTSYVDWRST